MSTARILNLRRPRLLSTHFDIYGRLFTSINAPIRSSWSDNASPPPKNEYNTFLGSLPFHHQHRRFTNTSLTNSPFWNNNHHSWKKDEDLVLHLAPIDQQRQQKEDYTISLSGERRIGVDDNGGGLLEWIRHLVNVPKGFENFYPKEKKNVEKKKKKSADGEEATKKEGKKISLGNDNGKNEEKAGGGGGGFGGGGGGGGGGEWTNVVNSGVLLTLLLIGKKMVDYNGGDGNEITWTEFRNFMLEPGDVEKIIIVNKKMARVHLRQGARGIPPVGEDGTTYPPSSYSSNQQRRLRQQPQHQTRKQNQQRLYSSKRDDVSEWNDGTVIDLGSAPSGTDNVINGGDTLPNSNLLDDNKPLVYHFNIGSVESFEEKLTRTQEELGFHSRDFIPVQYSTETDYAAQLLSWSPMLLGMFLMFRLAGRLDGIMGGGGRGGGRGIFQFGKSNAKKINKEDISITFKDVAGCQEAKREIMEFVDFLQDSTRFTKLGAKIPKGALLCGPPGTGKTLLAKAVAGESGVPFFSVSGSDFIEMFVGVGPSRVRDLFKEARSNAPCIVFIDEIDAVGRKRGQGSMSGGNDERENTLNQLLVEMDGFSPSSGVVVLAGTNRADILDDALTRPGRFDRQIQVDKPDLQGRKEIFLVHLDGKMLDGEPDDFAGRLAGLTPGFAGADIANVCNEAAIVAARRDAESIQIADFEKATDRVVGGLESNKIMSKEERNIVAHHEAGHAVAGWFLEHADPLLKVTIIPRSSGALGFAQYLPKEVFLRTQDQIMDVVAMALAGRAAEEIFFGRVTTGASNDLERVTQLVYSTIQVYGMNTKLGQLAFPKDQNSAPGDKPYSDATAEVMDEEARSIVDAAYQRTLNLIRDKKNEVQMVANLLLEKETITHDDVVDLIGPRPFKGDDIYTEFVSRREDEKKRKREQEEKERKELEDDSPTAEQGGGGGGLAPGLV